jgi:DUF177 domain-containing protein
MSTVVDVRDLLDGPGSSRTVRVDEAIAGLATQLALVPEDRQVEGSLLLESVTDGILVSGSVSGLMTLSCARCLKSFDRSFDLGLQELFVPGAQLDDDEYPVDDGHIDLDPMIRDAVILSMPFAPTCRPDCRGLCPRCGGDRNLGECSCPEDVDPRWAPLSDLKLTD